MCCLCNWFSKRDKEKEEVNLNKIMLDTKNNLSDFEMYNKINDKLRKYFWRVYHNHFYYNSALDLITTWDVKYIDVDIYHSNFPIRCTNKQSPILMKELELRDKIDEYNATQWTKIISGHIYIPNNFDVSVLDLFEPYNRLIQKIMPELVVNHGGTQEYLDLKKEARKMGILL